ncbi:MAG: hypothetical protein B7X94_04580 [Hydrogenophilales bacterium 17-62-8]|nr:MAG: hypothetical protein B7X94_04580 [Hydrogenophilales bacterium 17-62-8]
MNPDNASPTGTPEAGGFDPETAMPLDAEARLERNRAILRQRLERPEARPRDGILGEMGGIAAPLARQWVRQHPYAGLGGAALAGALLVRWKPWRGLTGSLLAGLLMRKALNTSLHSGGHALNWLLDAARNSQSSTRKP